MDLLTFTELQKNSDTISAEDIQKLEKIVQTYPYFQSASALLLKGLKQNDNYKYNKVLKTTAVLTIDRNILFDYIIGSSFSKSKQIIPKVTKEKIETKKTLLKQSLQIGSPLEFNKDEAYSFNQWLQLTHKKPITRGIKTQSSLYKNIDLIDEFIHNSPTIRPISKDAQNHSQTEDTYNEKELMTETLAKVYLEQKKYSNAIKAYDILILKYPEKSGFFADQIKRIEYLKNK
ncbi:hypothetical protein [Flavicella sp.]|uniref:hypothetical protein n=1 Tax=Flavicella sp. TaxID=2957742 RepID=UPI00301784DA